MGKDTPDCVGRGELWLDNGVVVRIEARGTFEQCAAALRGCVWKELMPTRTVSLSELMAAATD